MAHVAEPAAHDIEQHLESLDQESLLRFITCGSVDDGKSTLIGRLLYESQMLFEDQLEALEADSKKVGTQGGNLDFALLLDGLRRMDEMERFRARIPGSDARPRRTGKDLASVEPGAREIVDLSDGKCTLGEIAARTALGEFETTKAVFKLLDSGHLSLSPP